MVDERIITIIKRLQSLDRLQSFYLAGGTSLSIRLSHRDSNDIDLFCEDLIGIECFKKIEEEIRSSFPNSLFYLQYPTEKSDELVFLRFTLKFDDFEIKVECIQAFKLIDPIETVDGIRMASVKDVGVFKVESLANRYALKDLFDLDIITEKISLSKLIDLYYEKKLKYNQEGIKTIFHYENKICPYIDPLSLIENRTNSKSLPFHSQPHLIKGVENRTIIYHISNFKIKVKSENKRRYPGK